MKTSSHQGQKEDVWVKIVILYGTLKAWHSMIRTHQNAIFKVNSLTHCNYNQKKGSVPGIQVSLSILIDSCEKDLFGINAPKTALFFTQTGTRKM